jgi:hypothetical protein
MCMDLESWISKPRSKLLGGEFQEKNSMFGIKSVRIIIIIGFSRGSQWVP